MTVHDGPPAGPGGSAPTRRTLLLAAGASAALVLAGCAGGGGDGVTTARDPAQVTTTRGDDVEILVAQVVVRQDDDGPRVRYRLRNEGDADATIAVRTVLAIEEGGTYEATALVDVPAGDEVTIEYRVVTYDELTAAEETNVRQGNTDFSVYVNGRERAGV